MKKILCLGSPLTDFLSHVNEEQVANAGLIKGGMQLVDDKQQSDLVKRIGNTTQAAGGSAANSAIALGKIGNKVSFSGVLGKDSIAEAYKKQLALCSVNDKTLTGKQSSGKVLALITPDGERSFATFLGAATEFNSSHLTDELFNEVDLVYLEGFLIINYELIHKIGEICKERNIQLALDLGSPNVVSDNLAKLKDFVRSYVDIVFANEDEALAYNGLSGEECLNALNEDAKLCIIKRGDKGSLVRNYEEKVDYTIDSVAAVDTTGAGDYYAAGFLAAYSRDMSLYQACQWGSILSKAVVQVTGAQLSSEQWNEINKELATDA